MKKNIKGFVSIFKILILLIFAFGTLSFTKSSPKSSKIKILKNEINIGKVRRNEPHTFMVVYKNTGNDDLIVTDVLPDCSCTTVEYPKKKIKPKQTGYIKVTFDASRFLPGTMQKHITVCSNASNNEVEITFKVHII